MTHHLFGLNLLKAIQIEVLESVFPEGLEVELVYFECRLSSHIFEHFLSRNLLTSWFHGDFSELLFLVELVEVCALGFLIE